MRKAFSVILAALASATTAPATVWAEPTPTVIACESLVTLRVLMAAGERPAMEAALPGHPACRTIARDRIGAPEHRAMVGGAPFECLAVAGESVCAWVLP